MRRNTETLTIHHQRAYSLDVARENGFDIPESKRLAPLDSAVDGLTLTDEDADTVLKTLYLLADMQGPCYAARLNAVRKAINLLSSLSYDARTILLDAIARRPRKETAQKLHLSKGRLSQIIASLRALSPIAYYIITGRRA